MADTSGTETQPELGEVGRLVLDLAPELGQWLFGEQAAAVLPTVQAALGRTTGSSDPGVQAGILADPAKAALLRVALSRIAADQADAAGSRLRASLLAGLDAAGTRPVPSRPGRGAGWGAAIVSLVVLLTFAAVVVVALTRTMPPGAEPVLNVLLGTLGAMATSVVGYWVGSSAGSARKEERLASLAERS